MSHSKGEDYQVTSLKLQWRQAIGIHKLWWTRVWRLRNNEGSQPL